MSVDSPETVADHGAVLARAEAMAASGRRLEAVDQLHSANRAHPDPDVECRLADFRHQAFGEVSPASTLARWPVPSARQEILPVGALPHVPAGDLDVGAVRRGIATAGSVVVPGLLDRDQVEMFVAGIDHVLALRAANQHTPYKRQSSWFAGLSLPREEAHSLGRPWIAGAGGVLACDTPKLLDLLFTTYEDVGLRTLLTAYLGERPVLSANKCTLRRVPTDASTDWHQDGAFLGSGLRALNVWVALTDCGEDAPGMDLVPRRFEEVQETGTGGAIFDWAVGPDVVASVSEGAPPVRPRFAAGDAVLFDDLCLHRTAIGPAMTTPRYAIESWFFARTGYPDGQVPLVW